MPNDPTQLATLTEQSISGTWNPEGYKALVSLVAMASSTVAKVDVYAAHLQKIAESPSGTVRQANSFYLRLCTA